MKLRNSFILVYVPIVVILVIISGMIVLDITRNVVKEEIIDKQMAIIVNKVNNIEKDFTTYKILLEFLVHDLALQNFVRMHDADIISNASEYENSKMQFTHVLLDLAKHNEEIFQIRYIDNSGNEVIRIEGKGESKVIVPEDKLQNKSDRDYFTSTMNLGPEQVYVSPLDLNVEYGIVQTPFIPMIRYAIPIFNDVTEEKSGMVILNVNASKLLDDVDSLFVKGFGMMFDDKGTILTHPDKDKEFGPQIGNNFNIFSEEPELEKNTRENQFLTYYDEEIDQYRIWSKINYDKRDENNYWVIANVIPGNELLSSLNVIENYTIFTVFISSMIAIIVTIIATNYVAKPMLSIKNAVQQITTSRQKIKLPKFNITELNVLSDSVKALQESIIQAKMFTNEYQELLEKELQRKKEYEEKLQSALESLKKAEIQKEQFASMVTHELKTPLTPIRGYCEMLLEDGTFGTLNKDQRDFIERIVSNADRLQRLIGDVLDAQKLDMNKMEFVKTDFESMEFLDKIKNDLSPTMKDKQIQFSVKDMVQSVIHTDRVRLQQVLDNLILNAVDFVPQNGAKIDLWVENVGKDITFHVKDNGIGIPRSKHHKLFKKFYQIDTSHTRKHGGTGLGLTICKGIVDKLDGKIWFESEEGKGAEFFVSIPQKD